MSNAICLLSSWQEMKMKNSVIFSMHISQTYSFHFFPLCTLAVLRHVQIYTEPLSEMKYLTIAENAY